MRRLSGLVAAAATGALLFSSSVTGAATWTTPRLVWDGDYHAPSMVADPNGHVFIAARGDTGIWLLTNRTGLWTRTRLTTDDGAIHGENPFVARDPTDGSLTVVYMRITLDCCPTNSDIRYVTNRSGSWSDPKTIPGAPIATSVAARGGVLAVTGRVGLFDAPTIVFITNASGAWTTTKLGKERLGGPYEASLALTSQLRPVIAFTLGALEPEQSIRVATGHTQTGSFTYTTVVTGMVGGPSLVLTAANQPRVAYVKGDNLWYASKSASGWTRSRVLDQVDSAALALDGVSRPHLAVERNTDRPWAVDRPGGAWQPQRLDAREISGFAMAVTGSGRVSVVYVIDSPDGARLWYTHSTAG